MNKIIHPAISLFTFIAVVFLVGPAQQAQADIAPPPPPEGGNIQPIQPNQVRMMAETVLVDVAATTGKQVPYAKVTAAFTMRNLSSQEERMDVRFPLNLLFPQYQGDIEDCPYPQGGFPEINTFRAQVNGKPAGVSTIYKRMEDPSGRSPARDVACWAKFPVNFPSQEDVLIEVSYTAEGYFGWNVSGLVEFPYVLVTGEGWAGTIGAADITIRAPYELSALTLMGYSPEQAVVDGREVHWHFEDQEPGQNISATIVNPAVWDQVGKERQAVDKNPRDGEAWGRLGKAYKETIMLSRGYRWDEGGPQLYRLSREAYEKCVNLLPKDADWHFGYGELLWWNAAFSAFGTNTEKRDDLVKAAEQFSLALQINPNHARTLEEVDGLRWFGSGLGPLVDLEGAKPVFLLLTTTPTARPTEIILPTETQPLLTATSVATATLVASATLVATATTVATATEVAEATQTLPAATEIAAAPTAAEKGTPAGPGPTATPAPAGKSGGIRICGVGLAPLVGLAWLALRKEKKIRFLLQD